MDFWINPGLLDFVAALITVRTRDQTCVFWSGNLFFGLNNSQVKFLLQPDLTKFLHYFFALLS